MMSGKEKIYFLLNRIEDKRILTPKGQPVLIHPANDLNNNYSIVELSQLFIKLETDEKILKVLKEPTRIMTVNLDPYSGFEDGCYHLELLPAFDEYYSKIRQEPEYQEFTGKKLPNPKTQGDARPKYSRKALEKIWNILQEIEEKRQLGAPNEEIKLYFMPQGFHGTELAFSEVFADRESVLKKLENLGAISHPENTGELQAISMTAYSVNIRVFRQIFLSRWKDTAKQMRITIPKLVSS